MGVKREAGPYIPRSKTGAPYTPFVTLSMGKIAQILGCVNTLGYDISLPLGSRRVVFGLLRQHDQDPIYGAIFENRCTSIVRRTEKERLKVSNLL